MSYRIKSNKIIPSSSLSPSLCRKDRQSQVDIYRSRPSPAFNSKCRCRCPVPARLVLTNKHIHRCTHTVSAFFKKSSDVKFMVLYIYTYVCTVSIILSLFLFLFFLLLFFLRGGVKTREKEKGKKKP